MNRRRVAVNIPAAAPTRVDVEAPVKNLPTTRRRRRNPSSLTTGRTRATRWRTPTSRPTPRSGPRAEDLPQGGRRHVRCAEAYIKAGLEPEESRWRLAAPVPDHEPGLCPARHRPPRAAWQPCARTPPGRHAGPDRLAGPQGGFPPGLGGAPRRTAGVEPRSQQATPLATRPSGFRPHNTL